MGTGTCSQAVACWSRQRPTHDARRRNRRCPEHRRRQAERHGCIRCRRRCRTADRRAIVWRSPLRDGRQAARRRATQERRTGCPRGPSCTRRRRARRRPSPPGAHLPCRNRHPELGSGRHLLGPLQAARGRSQRRLPLLRPPHRHRATPRRQLIRLRPGAARGDVWFGVPAAQLRQLGSSGRFSMGPDDSSGPGCCRHSAPQRTARDGAHGGRRRRQALGTDDKANGTSRVTCIQNEESRADA
mmetsp:Transcript_61664/g.145738  ORF Transcript_61664/g.145738 Transcript_61664/m.145738 type:complete len:243 (+) Transcript_61664:2286-3014(+)